MNYLNNFTLCFSLTFTTAFFYSLQLEAQIVHKATDSIPFNETGKSIQLSKLASDKHSSSFLIYVKDSVRAHFHEKHTEALLVLEGSAEMRLGKKLFEIQKGDFINIPKGTVHSVKVNSLIPLKVLSVQAPEFFGKDRQYPEED